MAFSSNLDFLSYYAQVSVKWFPSEQPLRIAGTTLVIRWPNCSVKALKGTQRGRISTLQGWYTTVHDNKDV